MNYNKSDLVSAVAHSTGVSKKQVDEILTATLDVIGEETRAGKSVNLLGFGRFSEKLRAARNARNPRTGETVAVPESRALIFKASKSRKSD
ncbi:MAG: HU family DNA-binding protein [Paracoccus denitrificans]|nr:MAG: HU family DNA-binding protein [Paracoccus denitrificans]PZO83646.1 MAG: HU family DNA-binding protein [Paracoccus denitrificans]